MAYEWEGDYGMTHIVAFSGGIASAVVAKIVADSNDHADVVFLYHDTKTEPVDNDRFRSEVSKFVGIPITEVSDGRDIWQIFKDNKYLGNARNTMCSRILKRELSMEYCRNNKPCIIYFGFTPEEYRRAQNVVSRYAQEGIEARFPLIEQKISKDECRHRVENCWGIKPPVMYKHFNHANCMPCIKGKLAYWGLVYKYERKAWDRAVQAEKEHGHTILTDGRTLIEAKDECLRVVEKYEKKKEAGKLQDSLFEFPCDCAV